MGPAAKEVAPESEDEKGAGEMKGPTEKKATEAAEVLAASGLKTYTRSTDGAVMVRIAPHSYLSTEFLALGSGRGRVT